MSTASQRLQHVAADVLATALLEPGLVGVLLCEPEELPLQLDGGARPAVDELEGRAARGVVGHRSDGVDRADDRQVLVDEVVFDHRQDDRGGPDLEVGGDLAEVRVADDHVQAPVLLGVGVGLVARVDDRALQRGLEADLLLEEVGPLADLVVDGARAVLGADLARPGEHLAADEPRQQVAHEVRRTAPGGSTR